MNHPPEMSQSTLMKIRHRSGTRSRERSLSDGRSADYKQLCFNVNDFQVLAKKHLPKDLFEYLASGSDDEQTLSENRMSFKRWFIRPRVLRPVGRISTRTVLRFGRPGSSRGYCEYPVAMPIFVSPAGVHALCDEEQGECATARACSKASILFGLSQHSTRSIEEVAAATGTSLKFYQAYILKDRNRTLSLIRRALRAGYQGIFLTVDSVRFGYREADARNGFNALPHPHRLVNYDAIPSEAQTSMKLDITYNSQEKKAWDQNSEQMFEQDVSWEDVAWIKSELANERKTKGDYIPLVIKGIMTAEDAMLAIKAGADAIMISNHGGRQLDGCLSAIDVLPEVVKVVNGSVPIWIDGGIRRGTDVLKALGTFSNSQLFSLPVFSISLNYLIVVCNDPRQLILALGASAVGIGKPVFFALGLGGEDALSYLLHLLHTELEAAMAICGIEKIEDICRSYVTRHPISANFQEEALFQGGTRVESRL